MRNQGEDGRELYDKFSSVLRFVVGFLQEKSGRCFVLNDDGDESAICGLLRNDRGLAS